MNLRVRKALTETTGLIRRPQRLFPLVARVAHDQVRVTLEQRNLYSYTTPNVPSSTALASLMQWILSAQRPDGGIAAYYSLLSGYSASYPEVTGYLVPTLYELATTTGDGSCLRGAERATAWLLAQQMENGAFPAGLQGSAAHPSVFNTGQILQGLVRAWSETGREDVRERALHAGNWLVKTQNLDGSWSGTNVYQGTPHTYYSMVAWALAQLAAKSGDESYGLAAEKNMRWVIASLQPNGWIEGLGLRDHPNYLHFVAYAIQGVLECAILRNCPEAVRLIAKPAWLLLRKFEVSKRLPGGFDHSFQSGHKFACLTGNAQMSGIWLRLFEVTRDLRYLNAALKMNEVLKELLPMSGRCGIVGGISGSYPIWGPYQPLRYISWGCKFFADALLLEQKLMQSLEASVCAS